MVILERAEEGGKRAPGDLENSSRRGLNISIECRRNLFFLHQGVRLNTARGDIGEEALECMRKNL